MWPQWPSRTLTFRPGNYTRRFSYGFEVMVRDLGEWRPGFYSEFRCASHEHSGLAWGDILENMSKFQEMHKCSKWTRPNFQEIVIVPGQKPRRERQDTKELFRNLPPEIHSSSWYIQTCTFSKTIDYLSDEGVDCFIEAGPGKVLMGLNRRINKEAMNFSIDSMDAIESLKNDYLI